MLSPGCNPVVLNLGKEEEIIIAMVNKKGKTQRKIHDKCNFIFNFKEFLIHNIEF